MKDFKVKVSANTSKVYLDETSIAVDGENLMGKIIFEFDDFVDGIGRLEWQYGTNKYYQLMDKENNTYTLPIKNVMTHEGKMFFQLVVTQIAVDEEIPVFKSNEFYVYVEKSINAEGEAPDEYETWLDTANEKIFEMTNLNITASKSGNTEMIILTDKEGIEHETYIYDGEIGPQGPQGEIGRTATIEVGMVTTLPAGSDATVQNVGTENDGIFNFGIPQGEQGEQGEQGPQGDDYVITQQDYNSIAGVVETDIQPTLTEIGNTANNANTNANTAKSIAEGANQALAYSNYSTMVTTFNALDDDVYRVGQNVYIQTREVPDLWVYSVESTSSTYTYTTDEAFISALTTNGYVQVGYYKLSALETQKVDLTDYVKNTDYANSSTGGVVKVNSNYGIEINSGTINPTIKTYAQYQTLGNDYYFISKGTLENVLGGKFVTLTQAQYDALVSGGTIDSNTYYYIIEE